MVGRIRTRSLTLAVMAVRRGAVLPRVARVLNFPAQALQGPSSPGVKSWSSSGPAHRAPLSIYNAQHTGTTHFWRHLRQPAAPEPSLAAVPWLTRSTTSGPRALSTMR